MESIQNTVQLIGRTGQDLVITQTQNANKYVRFSIATNEKYTDDKGESQTNTHWHPVVAWGKLAENLSQYVKKGNQVAIKGKLQSRQYETNQGEKRFITEVLAKDFMLL